MAFRSELLYDARVDPIGIMHRIGKYSSARVEHWLRDPPHRIEGSRSWKDRAVGYLIHITRREHWSDDGLGAIERWEWEEIVRTDPDLMLYDETEADAADPCYKLDIPDLDHVFYYSESTGTIEVARGHFDLTLAKVREIARRLGAVVEGDEGEYYYLTSSGKETSFDRPDPSTR